jgi:hypothetical protein
MVQLLMDTEIGCRWRGNFTGPRHREREGQQSYQSGLIFVCAALCFLYLMLIVFFLLYVPVHSRSVQIVYTGCRCREQWRGAWRTATVCSEGLTLP